MNVLIFNLRHDADDGVLGFTTDWVNAIARRCDQVVVITMAMGTLRLEPNVTVYSVGMEKGRGKIRRLFTFYALLWNVLRRRRIDACFAHMNHTFSTIGAPLLKAFRVPTLLWYAHKSVTRRLRAAEKLVDAVVTSSPTGFQLPSRKLTVIGQGIDTDRFSPPLDEVESPRRIRLLSFGRISRIKRLEIILQALGKLRETEPGVDFECLIAGDPLNPDGEAYWSELQAEARALGLEGRVRFAPGVPYHQAQHIFAQADIFLNPGDTDSVDKTGLEAMSCAVPMITSNIAFKDIIRPDMQPFTIVPKNEPATLAAAIATMAHWPRERLQAFGLEARRTVVEEHSLDSLANKIVAALTALVRAKGRGPKHSNAD